MNRMQLKIVMLEVDITLNIPQWIYGQNLKELANTVILWHRLFLKRGKPAMEDASLYCAML